ncbi:MAG TPA: FAD-binding oxidoreductase, partial [Candidatus Lokiarchaeia archaeon]|nr:FAD-binding oxidoreductase [Candidatus Lokiarchaeia archaeon]
MIPVEMLDDLKAIVGDENVSTDPTELYVYGADASLHLVPPGAIVKPVSTAEVADVVKTCQKYHVSLTPRGAATSLAGQDLNLDGGLILDMRRMAKILEISIPDRIVRAQPGIIYGKLNIALKKKGFFFPPEPGSATFCTLGGMVGNNASGMGSVKYGPTRMHVLDLEVVLPNGEIMHTGTRVIKSSATYDLTQLFVGSGGTLGVITEVMLRITPIPKFRETLIVSFDHVRKAAECAVDIQQQGVVPEALELLSSLALSIIKDGFPTPPRPETLAEMGAMLFIEVTGNTDDATKSEAQIVYDICQNYAVEVVHIQDPIERDKWWHVRDSLAQKLAKVRQEKWFNVV